MGRISVVRGVTRTFAVLALAVLAVAPSAAIGQAPAPVLPPTAHPYGQSYSAWAADWWQWALEQPTPTNPLVDPTGANCASGQGGRVWFLAGSLTSDPVQRRCTVPTGTPLVFPVVNAFACTDPGAPVDEDALRAQIAGVKSATDLVATIDGVAVRDVAAYYEESERFSVVLPRDNIFGAPPGRYEPCLDAGYYLAVRPLPPGDHTIHFSGSLGELDLDVTYVIIVAPRHG